MALTGSQTTPRLQQSLPRKRQPSRQRDSAASQRWPTVKQRAWLAQRHQLATSACKGHGAGSAGSEFGHSRVRQGNCTRHEQLRELALNEGESKAQGGQAKAMCASWECAPTHEQLVHEHSKGPYTHTAKTCSTKVCCKPSPIQADPAKEHNREAEIEKTKRLQGQNLQAALRGSTLNTPCRTC